MNRLSVLVLLAVVSGCIGTRHFNPMKREKKAESVAPVKSETPPAPEKAPEAIEGEVY